jgi:hypothetical protein
MRRLRWRALNEVQMLYDTRLQEYLALRLMALTNA